MTQEPDILQMIIDSFRSAFASSAFRNLFLFALSGVVLSSCFRWLRLLCHYPCFSRHKENKQASEKEPFCAFHCDCEDCNSYESGKYCSRCDRFQICAYCSAREHCDL